LLCPLCLFSQFYTKIDFLENFATEPIGEFKEITKNYVDWFNNRRISQKTKGMTPCEYREHALAV
ncbi:IS3 family transposase, partial [Lactococcus lactis]